VGVVNFGLKPGMVVAALVLVDWELIDTPDWASHPAAVPTAIAAINIAVVLRIICLLRICLSRIICLVRIIYLSRIICFRFLVLIEDVDRTANAQGGLHYAV
jgi:hypothetical protein